MPTNWGWWVFTVIVGIVTGLFVNLISPSLGDRIGKWRKDRREKAREQDAKAKANFEKAVQRLFLHQSFVDRQILRVSILQRGTNMRVIVALIFFIGYAVLLAQPGSSIWVMSAGIVFLVTSIIFFIRQFNLGNKANQARDVLDEYIRRLEFKLDDEIDRQRIDYEHDLDIDGLIQASSKIPEEE